MGICVTVSWSGTYSYGVTTVSHLGCSIVALSHEALVESTGGHDAPSEDVPSHGTQRVRAERDDEDLQPILVHH